MQTAFLSDPACTKHEMMAGHPESPNRLAAIADRLLISGVLGALLQIDETPRATREDLLGAHTSAYLDALEARLPTQGYTAFDADTMANAFTREAILHAAGAAVLATELVLSGRVKNAFCAIRPPGHHATRSQAMGFCFVNHVAVAARMALGRGGLRRVAIVDFDVHHGNGTEEIVAGDERILLVGTFQHPFYPFQGAQAQASNILSVPLAAGAGGAALRAAVTQAWLPALESFAPEMIFISAGFDAHAEDPLGGLQFVAQDFRWVTEQIMGVADRHAHGRIVSVLEGGYDDSALGRCVEAHVRALAGL
jgi:acetoin utilization deacetylase AcuC-like enzyme